MFSNFEADRERDRVPGPDGDVREPSPPESWRFDDDFIPAGPETLGDTDKAFEALSAAVDRREGQTIWMATEPRLRQLRKDARFRELLSKMRLPAIE